MTTSGTLKRLRDLLPELEYARETHRQWRDCDQIHRDRNPQIGSAEFHAEIFEKYNERIAAINEAIYRLTTLEDVWRESEHDLTAEGKRAERAEAEIARLKSDLAEKRDEAMRLRAENDRLYAGLSREQAQMASRGMDIPWVRASVERLDSLLKDE